MTSFNVRTVNIVSALLCLSVAGCNHHSEAPPVHALPVSLRSVTPGPGFGGPPATTELDAATIAIIHVRTLPLYQQAQQACAARLYSHAANLLLKLSHTSGLNPDEIAFCLAQANVCRKDAGLQPQANTAQQTPPQANTAQQTPPQANTAKLTPNASSDCGPRALAIVLAQLGVKLDLAALRTSAGTDKDGTTMEGLAKAARVLGLKAEGVQIGRDALAHLQTPAIAWTGNHFIAVLKITGGAGDAGTATVHDPNQDHETDISQEQLLRRSQGGYLLLIHR